MPLDLRDPFAKVEAGDGWDGYPSSAWGKPSRAVIASDGNGNGVVLFTVGPHLRMEIEECGLVTLEDLGLDNAPRGLSAWAGKTRYHRDHEGGYVFDGASGKFARLTRDELDSVYLGVCPWSDKDWR